ncbi:hypothetical protein CLOLEP_01271 [[Clostridium] leptum DSM 753]|uniref:Uncharacterized protein n=1 Tax=[Clostridium] leptum DSM 753 TaxID=428125 RepID=A7VRT7_9FIRM|nr:hypothetical protein CLOLEP_01271 [[Clostridium] leptum DSM 753]
MGILSCFRGFVFSKGECGCESRLFPYQLFRLAKWPRASK